MEGIKYAPARWSRAAAAAWRAGERDKAVRICLEAIDGSDGPDADSFIQGGFYLFQLSRFADSAAIFAQGAERFPDHPMMLLSLGGSLTRAGKHAQAIAALERFLSLGFKDATAFDALAHSYGEAGNRLKAQLFGAMALEAKDKATKPRWGTPRLRTIRNVDDRPAVISFTLFGNDPRYLRGALHNLLAARKFYPGWTCRFYVDPTLDPQLLETLASEGADVRIDGGEADVRHLLSRRFLVADDPSVGRFLIRDCDSVVSEREAEAVAEWIRSGLPFHVMRDWYTHTDPLLAGMWGGFARAFPGLQKQLKSYMEEVPASQTWDQLFLRDRVWPAIRDHAMIHDRCFQSYRASPFPGPAPAGRKHVGENEFLADPGGQASAIAEFGERVPALKLSVKPFQLRLKTKLESK